jgi:hypothetical protein
VITAVRWLNTTSLAAAIAASSDEHRVVSAAVGNASSGPFGPQPSAAAFFSAASNAFSSILSSSHARVTASSSAFHFTSMARLASSANLSVC